MRLLIITALIAFLLIAIGSIVVNAAYQDYIDVTVAVGVCGNGVAEGGEKCDRDDLRGRSCKSLGYDFGELICDNACSYDPTVCRFTVSGTTVSSGSQRGQSDGSGRQDVGADTQEPESVASDITLIPVPRIPLDLETYDENENGIIDGDELALAVGTWVEFWRGREVGDCDLNEDGVCSLVDFSIMLYHSRS